MRKSKGKGIQVVKRGRRTYGAIYTLPSGKTAYLAWRKVEEIYRSGEKNISAAVRLGTAAWALDEETLIMLRAKKIQAVGVLVRETGDLFLTDIGNFFDRKKAKVLNFGSRGGSLQRFLPLNYFQTKLGRVSL